MSAVAVDNRNLQKTRSNASRLRGVSMPNDVIDALLRASALKDGWSSHRAPKPKLRTVTQAFAMLQEWYAQLVAVKATQEIAPSLDGGIDLCFDAGKRWVSLFFSNDGVIEVERSDGIEVVVDGVNPVGAHMRWLLGKL